jgi:hypothetical protein
MQTNIRQNLVWFGELERKLAKLSKTTFTSTYRSSSELFYEASSLAIRCLFYYSKNANLPIDKGHLFNVYMKNDKVLRRYISKKFICQC